MEWAISQLLSYEWIFWLVFIGLTFIASYRIGWIGFLLSLCLLPWVVGFLDIQWIQQEMNKPDWDGTPDMDIIFYFGVIVRIVIIGLVLLFVGGLALFLRARWRKNSLSWQNKNDCRAL